MGTLTKMALPYPYSRCSEPWWRARIAQLLIDSGAVRIGRYQLSSGETSPYYIDVKAVLLSPVGMRVIGEAVWRRIKDWKPTAVAGMGVGGLSLAMAVAMAAPEEPGLPVWAVRDASRDHGTRQRVERGGGDMPRSVVIVEDVLTTGRSALTAARLVECAGGKVVGIYAVVDRSDDGTAIKLLRDHSYAARALLTARDILSRLSAAVRHLAGADDEGEDDES